MNEAAFAAARKTAFDLGWDELADEHPVDLRVIIARYLDALPKPTDRIAVVRAQGGVCVTRIMGECWSDRYWADMERRGYWPEREAVARYIVHASVPPPEPREVVEVSGEVETIDG